MLNLLKPIYLAPAVHLYKSIINSEYRRYWWMEARLSKIPRFTECDIKVKGWSLLTPDTASFLSAYKAIFVDQQYSFPFAGGTPRILDLGANIGLSVLFFKKRFPNASITAFEADPRIFGYLTKNIHGNGYTDVQLINKAAWHENTSLKFVSEGADGGRAAFSDDMKVIEVDAVDINGFLKTRQFDFIKMDIEGAEEFVLPACREYLKSVKYVFVEYHSRPDRKQCLNHIIGILSEAGFRIHIQTGMSSPKPFVDVKIVAGFDLMLNIFAWKDPVVS